MNLKKKINYFYGLILIKILKIKILILIKIDDLEIIGKEIPYF